MFEDDEVPRAITLICGNQTTRIRIKKTKVMLTLMCTKEKDAVKEQEDGSGDVKVGTGILGW